ncbi:MAG: FAD-dependent oxidoreductase, partial [Planctomycetes bacterium]|nr:FAD-dependent oxidoreductase [Planctomycetota bacterium]
AYLTAKTAGDVTNPRQDILVFRTLHEDVLHFNTTRVTGQSPVSPEGLSAAEFEGRRQTRELAGLFREKVPGFENSYIQKMAVLIGVRESRRVMGDYVLTVDDVLEGRKFPDGIACSSYPVDIHNPSGGGTVIRRVPEGDYYEIPYRSIVPSGVENLLMASRSISATHEAHASLRVMPVVTAIGEAAGAAAVMAIRGQVAPAAVDTSQLRAALREADAFVGEDV